MTQNGPNRNINKQLYEQTHLAIRKGFVWLLDSMWAIDDGFLSSIEPIMVIAVQYQHLPVIKWLHSKDEPIFKDSIRAACGEASVAILEYLLRRSTRIPEYANPIQQGKNGTV
jgi:hypothetical protein